MMRLTFFFFLENNNSQLSPLVTKLLELGQGHIFSSWPALGEF